MKAMSIPGLTGLFVAATAMMLFSGGSVEAQPAHACAGKAAEQALKLLRFHSGGDDRAAILEEGIKSIGGIKALKGKGRFDVIEVPGVIYKADYRMRMIYAQVSGECVLMGQEVIEASDPY